MSEQVVKIHPDKLQPHKDNSHYFHDLIGDEWELFCLSVERDGILTPLLVTANKDGSYTVLSGHQRLRAAKRLELTELPCLILEHIHNPLDIVAAANLGRTLRLVERLRIAERLLFQYGDARKDNGDGGGKNSKKSETDPTDRNRSEDGKDFECDPTDHNQNKGGAISKKSDCDPTDHNRKTRNKDGGNSKKNECDPTDHNRLRTREKVAAAVPGISIKDITAINQINQLPDEQKKEFWQWMDEHNPNKTAIRRRLQAAQLANKTAKEEAKEYRQLKKQAKTHRILEEAASKIYTPQETQDAATLEALSLAYNALETEISQRLSPLLRLPLPKRGEYKAAVQTDVAQIADRLEQLQTQLLTRFLPSGKIEQPPTPQLLQADQGAEL